MDRSSLLVFSSPSLWEAEHGDIQTRRRNIYIKLISNSAVDLDMLRGAP